MSDLDCPVCWNQLLDEIVITTTSAGEGNGFCNHSMCSKCFDKLREEAGGQPKCPLCRRTILSVTKNQLAMNIMAALAKEKGTTKPTAPSQTTRDIPSRIAIPVTPPTKKPTTGPQFQRPKKDVFRRTHSYSGRSEVFFDNAYNVHYDLRDTLQDLAYSEKDIVKKSPRFSFKNIVFVFLACLSLGLLAFMKFSILFCFCFCAIFCLGRYF